MSCRRRALARMDAAVTCSGGARGGSCSGRSMSSASLMALPMWRCMFARCSFATVLGLPAAGVDVHALSSVGFVPPYDSWSTCRVAIRDNGSTASAQLRCQQQDTRPQDWLDICRVVEEGGCLLELGRTATNTWVATMLVDIPRRQNASIGSRTGIAKPAVRVGTRVEALTWEATDGAGSRRLVGERSWARGVGMAFGSDGRRRCGTTRRWPRPSDSPPGLLSSAAESAVTESSPPLAAGVAVPDASDHRWNDAELKHARARQSDRVQTNVVSRPWCCEQAAACPSVRRSEAHHENNAKLSEMEQGIADATGKAMQNAVVRIQACFGCDSDCGAPLRLQTVPAVAADTEYASDIRGQELLVGQDRRQRLARGQPASQPRRDGLLGELLHPPPEQRIQGSLDRPRRQALRGS